MLDKPDKYDRSGIQVIARAAAILRLLKDDPNGLSLAQIAERASLPRSTVQRIVGALATERLVMSEPNGSGLRLGPEIGLLADAARYDIAERCRSVLTELAQETSETTDLAVLRGTGLLFLDQVPGSHRLRTVSFVGEVFPLTTTANGRACLALMSEARARKLIDNEWKRSGTQGDIEEMVASLNAVRNDGLAYDLDEHTAGISAIGFAFLDLNGDHVAISVPVPTTRFYETKSRIETALRKAKLKIDEMMAA
ncbi:MAG: IclR family transcriptional regulator [Hyphomicrobiaceae bacterium]